MSAPAARAAWRVAPGGTIAGALHRPGRQIDLASRADARRHRRGRHAHQRLPRQRGLPGDARAPWARSGCSIERPAPTEVIVHGVGMHGWPRPRRPLDMGNAGTAMRLLMGLLARAALRLHADRRCVAHAPAHGARGRAAAADGRAASRPTRGARRCRSAARRSCARIDYSLPVASAQVKSAVLLAGLYAAGQHACDRAGALRAITPSACSAPSACSCEREGRSIAHRRRAAR